METRLRFAPSPTGRLHVGNARVALVNWLFARQAKGTFLLRLDDTDADRSTTEFARGIEEDLRWLGIEWDDFARQSARMERYTAALERLKKSNRLYACYETAEELEIKRTVLMSRGLPPIYDREALAKTADDHAVFAAEGRTPYWRFKLNDAAISWNDLARGQVAFEGRDLSDPVLVRADGRPLYSLSSVVDDGELFVTHVIRGEDHVANTAVQIQLFEALGYRLPTFAHLPLLADEKGQNLSKRLDSASLAGLRDDGIEALAVAGYLAHLGTAQAADGREDLSALTEMFDIGAFGRATPRFDVSELERLNARVLHHLPFELVSKRFASMQLDAADEKFWLAVRPNITRFTDVVEWWNICHGSVEPVIEDRAFCDAAAELLPQEPWDDSSWSNWTKAVAAATGRKGRELFHPLRLALTGLDHGPELKYLLPMLGRQRAILRLNGNAA
jgi:glutamyl-tRNA synthetase